MEDGGYYPLRSSIFDFPSREGSKEEPQKLPEDGRIFADQSLGNYNFNDNCSFSGCCGSSPRIDP
jgi:hypothetical protein